MGAAGLIPKSKVTQWVNDPLSLWGHVFDPQPPAVGKGSGVGAAVTGCRLQLWLKYDPWPGNFHMTQVWQGGGEWGGKCCCPPNTTSNNWLLKRLKIYSVDKIMRLQTQSQQTQERAGGEIKSETASKGRDNSSSQAHLRILNLEN